MEKQLRRARTPSLISLIVQVDLLYYASYPESPVLYYLDNPFCSRGLLAYLLQRVGYLSDHQIQSGGYQWSLRYPSHPSEQNVIHLSRYLYFTTICGSKTIAKYGLECSMITRTISLGLLTGL